MQGVSFRAFTLRQAQAHRLTGWVQNLPDGRVEFVAEGDVFALEQFLQVCQKGPPLSQVTQVETHWEEALGDLQPFSIRY